MSSRPRLALVVRAFLNLSRSPIDGFRSVYGKEVIDMEGILPVEKLAMLVSSTVDYQAEPFGR